MFIVQTAKQMEWGKIQKYRRKDVEKNGTERLKLITMYQQQKSRQLSKLE